MYPKRQGWLKPQKLLISIRSSLWFLPALAVLIFAALALGLLEADRQIGKDLHQWWPRLFSTDAEGARSMLSAIAGSIATITGVAFSITIVALVLASNQYTSRVLRTFMRDRATQLILGVFVGVYIYCLVVLRMLSGNGGEFFPPLSALGGLLLAVVSVGSFIFFVHHISSSIQASEITAAITREALGIIDRLIPEKCTGTDDDEAALSAVNQLDWRPVPARTMGYIQTVDVESLSALAKRHGVIIRMERGVGDFVAPHLPMLSFSGPANLGTSALEAMDKCYTVDSYRTIEQDPGFGIRQLVDIALKALSPGINDTTTAVTCIEYLSVILIYIAQRRMPSSLQYEQGELRVIKKTPCFDQLVALSFNQILENAAGNTEILTTLAKAVAQIASVTTLAKRRAVLLQWIETIEEVAQRNTKSSYAVDQIKKQIEQAKSALK